MRIFCLFPEGRKSQESYGESLGRGENWYTWVLQRTAGYRFGSLGQGKGKGSNLPGWQPSQETWKRKTCESPTLYPSAGYATEELHMPCRYSRLTSQATRAQQAQDSAGSWHNLGNQDYPRHDEPVDPGSDELANHKDVFPFIIPGRNMTTLVNNSPDMLLFQLLHMHTCHSLTVGYGTNCSTAFLSSSGTTFQRC